MIDLGNSLDATTRIDGKRMRIDLDVLLDNSLILGGEGSGKTTLIWQLSRQLHAQGVRTFIFDSTGDLAAPRTAGELADTIPLDLGIAETMFYRPAHSQRDRESWVAEGRDLVAALVGLLGYRVRDLSPEFVLLESVVAHEWENARDVALTDLAEIVKHPPIASLGAFELDAVIGPERRSDLARAILTLKSHSRFVPTPNPHAIPERLFGEDTSAKVAVFALAHGSLPVRRFVAAVLIAKLDAYVQAQLDGETLQLVVIFDEAETFFPRARVTTTQTVLNLLERWPLHGASVMLVADELTQVDERAEDLCQTWIVGQIAVGHTRREVVAALDLVNPPVNELLLDDTLKRLEAGQFVLRSPKLDGLIHFETDPD